MPEGGRRHEFQEALRAVALRGLAELAPRDAPPPELGWLAALRGDGLHAAAVGRARRAPHPGDQALARLADALDLSDAELTACALVLAAELDVRVARAVASLQGTAGGAGPALPTLGLLARLAVQCALMPDEDDARAVSALLAGPAFSSGLLTLSREGRGAAEGSVAIPLPLVAALGRDHPRGRVHPAEFGALSAAPLPVPDWSLPATLMERLAALADEASRHPESVVIVRAPGMDEAKPIAALLARKMGRQPVAVAGQVAGSHGQPPSRTGGGLEPWLTVIEAVPVIALDAAPGEVWALPAFHWHRGPVLVAAGAEGEVDAGARTRIEFNVPWPSIPERAEMLRASLPGDRRGMPAHHVEGLARRSRVGYAMLHRIAEAVGQAAPGDADAVCSAATEAAASRGARTLAPLALPVTTRILESAFVVPEGLRRDMALLLARCEERETLTDTLGAAFSARYSPGVKALFVGASGTGKTLAAQWLAMRLAKPLFRVDLSAVSSKYIGETEKNLAQLLARAEGLDAVLLFDEADSLFGARTEVKQANDRFANAQTNYLLARIESFEGTALLTSNSQERFDHAFLRRLDAVVEFPLPTASERRALWDVHLGAGHALSPPQLNRLAAEVDFAGGHIRNTVLSAALLARSRGAPLIEWRDALDACAVEYAKLGRRPPDGLALFGS